MKKTYRYALYPTSRQCSILENIFSMCRHLYNWNLHERIETYKKTGKSISYGDQQNRLPQLKKERPWFAGVYSQVLQDVLRRLDKSFLGFYRRVKSGKTPGFPKFKKRGQWSSITYPQHVHRPSDRMITVPKLGKISIRYHREIPEEAEIKTLTITKEGGKWFACFSIEYQLDAEPKQVQTVLGLDLGLIDFVYDSDGNHISTPRFLRKSQKELSCLQRKLSKVKKRSCRYYKLLRALQKKYYKVRCQRLDFLHKAANSLLAKADALVVEKLEIDRMMRRPKPIFDEDKKEYRPNGAKQRGRLNKSIADAGWATFISLLKYKAQQLGKQIVEVDPRYTSQECSCCGAIVTKSLATRTHYCHKCGYIENRDLNAAKNILRLGLQSLGLLPLEAPTIMRSI